MTSRVDVAIIGAGPYGLSIAAHLGARGVAYRIFGSPMHTWKACMPEGMLLRSEGFASNLSDPSGELTLARFCAERALSVGAWRHPTPRDVYFDYGQWFIDRLALFVEDARLENLGRAGADFLLSMSDGETVRARQVVVATGLTHFAHVPNELADLPGELCSHSSAPLKHQDYAGRQVTIVGAGQSALETAALLHEHDVNVRVVARCQSLNWHRYPPALDERSPLDRLRTPIAGLGMGWNCWLAEHLPRVFHRLPESKRLGLVARTFGPAGAWWLRDRVEGRFPVLLARSVRRARARAGRVELDMVGPDGRETISSEHVIAATGYRVDLSHVEFLTSELRHAMRTAATSPRLSSRFESSVPGLYFVGAAATSTFGPVMRFVVGAEFAAPTIARRLSRKA
jgi:lysine/ornithine N-monooxygenase